MALKLIKAGVPTHVHMMSEFLHAWCNMDLKDMGVAEFRRGTILICNIFIELLGLERAN